VVEEGEVVRERRQEYEEQMELFREMAPEYKGIDWRSKYSIIIEFTALSFAKVIRSTSWSVKFDDTNALLIILVEYYTLENDEWKYDKIPEIMDGQNISDYIDPDLIEKLEALEREEEERTRKLQALMESPEWDVSIRTNDLFFFFFLANNLHFLFYLL